MLQSNTKRLIVMLGISALLLLVPFVSMQFTNEVQWSPFDFMVMTILLSTVIVSVEFIFRKLKTKRSKIIAITASALIFLIIWAELAVGIFGSPLAGN